MLLFLDLPVMFRKAYGQETIYPTRMVIRTLDTVKQIRQVTFTGYGPRLIIVLLASGIATAEYLIPVLVYKEFG